VTTTDAAQMDSGRGKNQAFLEWAETYAMACWTVVIFSLLVGISVRFLFERHHQLDGIQENPAPRSSTNEDSS